jgi:hypothetical protein
VVGGRGASTSLRRLRRLFFACCGQLGRLEMWRPGKPTWDLAVDIERGANLTVRETETEGPRFVRWVPSA